MRIYTFGLLTFPSVSSPGCGTDGLLLRQSFGTLLRRYDAVVHVQTITWNKQHNEQQKSTQGLQSSHILKNDNYTGIKWPPPLQPEHTEQQKPQAISLYRHREPLGFTINSWNFPVNTWRVLENTRDLPRNPEISTANPKLNKLPTHRSSPKTNQSIKTQNGSKAHWKKSTRMNQTKRIRKTNSEVMAIPSCCLGPTRSKHHSNPSHSQKTTHKSHTIPLKILELANQEQTL